MRQEHISTNNPWNQGTDDTVYSIPSYVRTSFYRKDSGMGLSRSLLLLITLSQFLQQHSCFRTGIVPRSTTKLHSATIQEKCNVHVYETCSEVGNALCSEFIEIGQTAIEEKGSICYILYTIHSYTIYYTHIHF